MKKPLGGIHVDRNDMRWGPYSLKGIANTDDPKTVLLYLAPVYPGEWPCTSCSGMTKRPNEFGECEGCNAKKIS